MSQELKDIKSAILNLRSEMLFMFKCTNRDADFCNDVCPRYRDPNQFFKQDGDKTKLAGKYLPKNHGFFKSNHFLPTEVPHYSYRFKEDAGGAPSSNQAASSLDRN